MTSAADPDLTAALAALWTAPPIEHDLYRAPAFQHLRETCQALFPNSGSAGTLDFALARALRTLACPATDPVAGQPPMTPEEAAERLTAAFRQTEILRVHLVPLDMADDFPRIAFGPAEAGGFTADEMRDLLQGPAGPRGRPSGLNPYHLAQFRWLIVREVTPDPKSGVQGRALPGLSFNANEDFGRIVPHAKTRPEAVEAALFALLLLPWEDHDTQYNPEYRVFRVPWIYTVEHDIFGHAPSPPDVRQLTEIDDTYEDDDGTPVTVERPYVINLYGGADEMVTALDHSAWAALQSALAHSLFAGPIAHFFVRAFFSEPIDEFLAHTMTLEAALGSADDYDSKTRWKLSKKDNPGPTIRLAARVTALLSDPAAGRTYEALFDLRSQYVHGRSMPDIPSDARLQARVLARRCVTALVDLALSSPSATRDQHLDVLLRAGLSPLRAHPKTATPEEPPSAEQRREAATQA